MERIPLSWRLLWGAIVGLFLLGVIWQAGLEASSFPPHITITAGISLFLGSLIASITPELTRFSQMRWRRTRRNKKSFVRRSLGKTLLLAIVAFATWHIVDTLFLMEIFVSASEVKELVAKGFFTVLTCLLVVMVLLWPTE